jgi:hypothetical protein
MEVADSHPRGCAPEHHRCCAQHNAMGTGAYLLSARGLELIRGWWPLREEGGGEPPGSDQPQDDSRAGGGGDRLVVSLVEPRACWSLPEAGCVPPLAVTGVANDSSAGSRQTSSGELGGGWRKLKPSLVADHCLSRPDLYGPPLTAREAQAQWTARVPRETAGARAAWRPYVATPPIVLGEREWAVEEAAAGRLHARGSWLALVLERGERFATGWWREVGGI